MFCESQQICDPRHLMIADLRTASSYSSSPPWTGGGVVRACGGNVVRGGPTRGGGRGGPNPPSGATPALLGPNTKESVDSSTHCWGFSPLCKILKLLPLKSKLTAAFIHLELKLLLHFEQSWQRPHLVDFSPASVFVCMGPQCKKGPKYNNNCVFAALWKAHIK